MKKIYILGGGTFTFVRNHLAMGALGSENPDENFANSIPCMSAFGETAIYLEEKVKKELVELGLDKDYEVNLVLTKMAHRKSNLITNEDVSKYVDELVADKDTKAIIFNIGLTDFSGQIGNVESGKYAERLRTSNGKVMMELTPTDKLISKIRKERKDIFVVGFKTTANFDSDKQYLRGLELLKSNSINLVLANDTVTRNNMIIVPEEARYCETKNREDVLDFLVKIMISRMQNKFTKSTVVDGESIDWEDKAIPQNLREVVNYCINEGAYKPFLGKTAGHFAVKVNEEEILTSIRKSNFNHLKDIGLVKVVSKNKDEVIAHGYKPSVGGQSQRIIFKNHPEMDCIVHFHCPVKDEYKNTLIPVRSQWQNECGSHECGQNTSDGLKKIKINDEQLSVVYLDEHGPNIVFNKKTSSETIINFINEHFNLKQKTGGLVI